MADSKPDFDLRTFTSSIYITYNLGEASSSLGKNGLNSVGFFTTRLGAIIWIEEITGLHWHLHASILYLFGKFEIARSCSKVRYFFHRRFNVPREDRTFLRMGWINSA